MPDQPHIRMPFNFGPEGQAPQTDEQQSDNEIQTCCENIIRYTIGFREDLPEFGIPDFSFKQAPVNLDPIREAILKYEPRAAALVSKDDTKLEEMIENVQISFRNIRS